MEKRHLSAYSLTNKTKGHGHAHNNLTTKKAQKNQQKYRRATLGIGKALVLRKMSKQLIRISNHYNEEIWNERYCIC